MAAMKRDVNVGLLLLIVAALLMFSGFTVYYQTTFKNLSVTYQNELAELGKVTKDLESKRSLLNETSVQLQLKQQKEEDLSKKFTDVRSERDQLDTDKKKLELDLATTKSTLSSTESKLTSTQKQLEDKLLQVADLSQQVLNLKADVDKLQDKVNDLDDEADCLRDKPDAEEGSC